MIPNILFAILFAQIRITRCIVIGRLSKQQAISGKRANVWGVSEWPLRMACCCFESRPMTMQRVIRI